MKGFFAAPRRRRKSHVMQGFGRLSMRPPSSQLSLQIARTLDHDLKSGLGAHQPEVELEGCSSARVQQRRDRGGAGRRPRGVARRRGGRDPWSPDRRPGRPAATGPARRCSSHRASLGPPAPRPRRPTSRAAGRSCRRSAAGRDADRSSARRRRCVTAAVRAAAAPGRRRARAAPAARRGPAFAASSGARAECRTASGPAVASPLITLPSAASGNHLPSTSRRAIGWRSKTSIRTPCGKLVCTWMSSISV